MDMKKNIRRKIKPTLNMQLLAEFLPFFFIVWLIRPR